LGSQGETSGSQEAASFSLPPQTNGQYHLDDDEAQNRLPKCLTFPDRGSSSEEKQKGKENFWFLRTRGVRISQFVVRKRFEQSV
jgi:hypothetical protein